MSRPNPFAQRDRPDSIVEADQPSLTAPAKLSNEKPRRRNPFRNGTAEQSPDTDGAFPHTDYPVDGDGNESVHSFRPLPAFRDTPRPLNSRDVCAFIVNKMVGSGIYTAPPVVLLLTKSKGEALGLWFIGFLYTLISMMIYLEFARRLPHTGGELVYLDETLPRPRLFAYTLYTFYFVLLYNTATNSMVFAQQVLICAAGDVQEPVLDQRALRFIAIVALSFFVLIHYFSGRAGRDLNQVMAFVKVLLLVIVFIAGIVRASHNYTSDWGIKPNKDASSSAIAFLYIVFSFTGWENATFVGGEIRDHQILRKGFIWAVMTVGVLYMLINFIFLLAVPAAVPTTQMAPLFFGGGYHARLAWAILIAISASGSLLSVAYTCARVKQVIGMSNVIPWSRLWKSNSTPETDANGIIMNSPTPQGGLLLHWIFSVTLITASAAVKDTSEAIHFPGNLQAYAAGWVGSNFTFAFM
ncbi:amino acid permease-domain-containing protein [Leptodontidium sp. 2 PMI_412]|nr:amino acid permease-domain-containing protein [Leptodontidium sp. MPI-SDFR-AT-0119]KAH9214709.1 amino acid permease-domain-containing protein [Leptodontidium sp. 2 PMI_412]